MDRSRAFVPTIERWTPKRKLSVDTLDAGHMCVKSPRQDTGQDDLAPLANQFIPIALPPSRVPVPIPTVDLESSRQSVEDDGDAESDVSSHFAAMSFIPLDSDSAVTNGSDDTLAPTGADGQRTVVLRRHQAMFDALGPHISQWDPDVMRGGGPWVSLQWHITRMHVVSKSCLLKAASIVYRSSADSIQEAESPGLLEVFRMYSRLLIRTFLSASQKRRLYGSG